MNNIEEIDLNIENYDYEDILNLFKLDHNFNEESMKSAKRMVLLMHPDKSKLDKQYFLFFVSAYKILYSIYNFRNNNKKLDEFTNNNIEYLAEKNEDHENLIKSLNKNEEIKSNFNKWFNEMFEKVKLEDDFTNSGYGNWLKSNDDLENFECKDMNSIHKKINEKKEKLASNALSNYKNINEFNNTNYCDLAYNKPESYSSGLFSGLQYEDLKVAHSETVVPVTENDLKIKYNSFDDIKKIRQQQNLDPLKEDECNKMLKTNKNNENIINSRRAYKLYKQEEEAHKSNEQFWKYLRRLN